MTPEQLLEEGIEEVMAHVRSSERLRAALTQVHAVAVGLTELSELDPFLLPELHAATTGLRETADALTRANLTLVARFSAKWGSDGTATTDTEGMK